MSIISIILIVLMLGLIIYILSIYVSVVVQEKNIKRTLLSLDELFMQRATLSLNLIASLQQFIIFEKETLEKILELRMPINSTTTEIPYLQIEEGSKILQQIINQTNNYPELIHNTDFTINGNTYIFCEIQIQEARRKLKNAITNFNSRITTFPTNYIAKLCSVRALQW